MSALRLTSEFKGSRGFGGFNGLLGTGVSQVVFNPTVVRFCC